MTKQMHTPGPWRVDSEAHQGPYIVGGSRAVAQMVHTHRKPLDYEEQANARLIAAAPDFLALAQDSVEILKVLIADRESANGEECEVSRDLLTRTEALLFKLGADQ